MAAAAIAGHDGSIWAKSGSFNCSPDEVALMMPMCHIMMLMCYISYFIWSYNHASTAPLMSCHIRSNDHMLYFKLPLDEVVSIIYIYAYMHTHILIHIYTYAYIYTAPPTRSRRFSVAGTTPAPWAWAESLSMVWGRWSYLRDSLWFDWLVWPEQLQSLFTCISSTEIIISLLSHKVLRKQNNGHI